MDFELSDEHQMIVDTVRSFTEKELMPHEALVEQLCDVPPELVQQIKQRRLGHVRVIHHVKIPTRVPFAGRRIGWQRADYDRTTDDEARVLNRADRTRVRLDGNKA